MHRLIIALAVILCPALAFAQEAAPPSAWDGILAQLAPGIVELVLSLVGLLVLFVRVGGPALVKAHTEKGAIQSALLLLTDTINALVTAAEQTLVKELRQAYADGKMTKAELDQALKQVADDVKRAALDATLGRLKGALGWSEEQAAAEVATRVEAAVPFAQAAVAAAKKTAPANP